MKALKVVAAFVLAASASCLAASPAQAQSPTFDVIAVDGATLLARGVAFSLKITYVCADVDFADGYVSAQQRVQGAQIARAEQYFAAACDGAGHMDDVIVTANEIPFKRGEALVTVIVGGCVTDAQTQQQTCGSDTLSQVLRIR
jgi:hypothetical protein